MNTPKISRRSFLKKMGLTSSVVWGMPFLINSAARGNRQFPPASERITLGHIGVGNQGGYLLRNFLQLPNTQSVAVCDPFQPRCQEKLQMVNAHYAQKFSKPHYDGCAAYTDFRELLVRPDIDAVIIATPDHWHVPLSIAAVRAGKAVYVEKPLGISVAENVVCREILQQHQTIFQYGTQQRSSRNFRFACELVRNQKIGKLHTIQVWCPGMYAFEQFNAPGGSIKPIPVPADFDYDLWLGPAPFIPYTSDRCTCWGTYYVYDNSLGFIAGWGAHPLDIAQWGNNTDHTAPIEYEGTGTLATGGLYNVIRSWNISAKYANGVKLHFMSDDIARPIIEKYHPNFVTHGTTFIGDKGWVSVDRSGIYAEPDNLLNIKLTSDDIHLYESNNHYQNFIDCVLTRSQPISTIEAAVQSDIISQLSDIVIRTGRNIKWDPATEQIINDPDASRRLSRPMRSPWRL